MGGMLDGVPGRLYRRWRCGISALRFREGAASRGSAASMSRPPLSSSGNNVPKSTRRRYPTLYKLEPDYGGLCRRFFARVCGIPAQRRYGYVVGFHCFVGDDVDFRI